MPNESTCPHCGSNMMPGTVDRGPYAGRLKCTACGKTFESERQLLPEGNPVVEVETPVPQPKGQGERIMPQPEAPKPKRKPTMPEQQRIEPIIEPPPTVEVEATSTPDPEKFTDSQWRRINDERDIRVRVKRKGGFIKGLAEPGKKKAADLMAKYGRKPEDGWDTTIWIPGFDNASHDTNQRHLYEKPVKMIQVEK